jgi:hypothetical protein
MYGYAPYDPITRQADTKALKAFVNTGDIIVQQELGSPPKPIAIDNQFGFTAIP